MASNKAFHLVVFGLSKHEQRILQTISILSRNRPRTYVLDIPASPETADFAIIDGDDTQSLAYWHAFQARNPMIPAVMVKSGPASELADSQVDRPIIATRLLAVLDQMSAPTERPALAPKEAQNSDLASSAGNLPVGTHTDMAVRRALLVDDSSPSENKWSLSCNILLGKWNWRKTVSRPWIS